MNREPLRSITEHDVAAYEREFEAALGLLLDSHGGDKIGGSGDCFDWDMIPKNLRKPIILAGGLNAANVAASIRRVRPYGVDVSSGVESAKGIKDIHLIEAFMGVVQRVESRA